MVLVDGQLPEWVPRGPGHEEGPLTLETQIRTKTLRRRHGFVACESQAPPQSVTVSSMIAISLTRSPFSSLVTGVGERSFH